MESGIGIYLKELTDSIFGDRNKHVIEEIKEIKWRIKDFKTEQYTFTSKHDTKLNAMYSTSKITFKMARSS